MSMRRSAIARAAASSGSAAIVTTSSNAASMRRRSVLPSSQPLSNATISKRRLSCSSNSSAARMDVAWLRNSPPR
jgi:hypothetical protein